MHPFDRDLQVEQEGRGRYRGAVSDHWSVNGIPNGGYLAALLAGAMRREAGKKHPLVITATFLNRCILGEARIETERIHASRRFERRQARLVQEGQERIRALGTFTEDGLEHLEKRYERCVPEVAPLEACVNVPALPRFTLMENLDLRLDPRCAGWLQGSPGGRSEQAGWIRFREDRPFDSLGVLLAADGFPPPVLASYGMVGWVPTIELTVNVRNLPASRWLKCVFRTAFLDGDILEEDGEVWDAEGGLVALSRQIAQFRRPGG